MTLTKDIVAGILAQQPQLVAGPQGPEGPEGPQGDQGLDGTQGAEGKAGERGVTGDTGPQGERGDTGPEGPRGPRGPKGDKGDKGDKGEPGTTGPAGPAGAAARGFRMTGYKAGVGGGGGSSGGAPADATYLVASANGSLSDEVVVGATPGGELGGTWASPTVDTTHSGSSHAAAQAAAESTAASALAAHEADTTSVHGIANTANLYAAGGTDVAVADGGTGASTAANARTNLGLGTLATQSGTFSGTSSGTNTGDQTVPPLTRTEATLSGDVTMATADTFYDGPTATPAAGTYDVWARVLIKAVTASNMNFNARLIANGGATPIDEAEVDFLTVNTFVYALFMAARVVADGTNPILIQATAGANNYVMLRDQPNGSASLHRATLLVLTRVA